MADRTVDIERLIAEACELYEDGLRLLEAKEYARLESTETRRQELLTEFRGLSATVEPGEWPVEGVRKLRELEEDFTQLLKLHLEELRDDVIRTQSRRTNTVRYQHD